MKDIIIGAMYDGWCVQIDGKQFTWEHNTSDLGVSAIKDLLEHLGRHVEIEEWY